MATSNLFGRLNLKDGKDGEPADYYLNGEPFIGISSIERLYDGESLFASQEPAGLDTSLEIQFGAPQGATSDPVQTIARGGNLEASILRINQTGLYRLKTFIQFGRATSTGNAILNFRALINGVQAGRSINKTLRNSANVDSFTDEAWLSLPAGVEVTYEVIRDSNGDDSGGLFEGQTSGSTGWNRAPCCAVRVERWA